MPEPSSVTSISSSPPAWSRTETCAAPASSEFSTSSLSALAGRSTTSPAAMRLMSSGGSLLIDMLRVLSQSQGAGEALFFPENSGCIQWPENNQELSSHGCAAAGTINREGGESDVLESLVQMDVARHGDRSWDRQYARVRPRPRH